MGEETREEEAESGFRVPWCVPRPLSFVWKLTCRVDDAHAARRRYKKDLDQIKPDLEAYNKQKAIAMGHVGSLVGFNPTAGSSSEVAVISQEQRLAAENLYRDANTLIYGDSKPSEDAIDRVVGKINKECVDTLHIYGLIIDLHPPVSTRRANSRASVSTKRRAISPTSTSTIASSTKRSVYLVYASMLV